MMKKLKFPYMTDDYRTFFATAILFGGCALLIDIVLDDNSVSFRSRV